MTASLQFSPRDRLQVFAPHPDDETIATGELIQSAREAGAAVRVVFATDGDNNPWPQRWLERRWHIGQAERQRWGQRRREEAAQALSQLGVDDRSCVRFLGWPDQGLTQLLMRDDSAVVALQDDIAAFAPTHLALPSLADRHPDHSALGILLDLALLRTKSECLRLAYTVHGLEALAPDIVLASTADHPARKQHAMCAHRSQVALSGRRLMRLASRPEAFFASGPVRQPLDVDLLHIPYRRGPGWRRRDLLLILASETETLRYRMAMPRFPVLGARAVLTGLAGDKLEAVWRANTLDIALPLRLTPWLAVVAKLHRAEPRWVVFDKELWSGCEEGRCTSSSPIEEPRIAEAAGSEGSHLAH